jgi:hypothetical protein
VEHTQVPVAVSAWLLDGQYVVDQQLGARSDWDTCIRMCVK